MQLSELTEERQVQCPYCGEAFATVVDCSAGSQTYVEDCAVCCQPILFRAQVETDGLLVELVLSREND